MTRESVGALRGSRLERVQGLWMGDRLSALEVLSIRSFLQNGHGYDLYAYGPVRGVPDGARVLDGRQIMEHDADFRYGDSPSASCFSNVFRYKLLRDRGGYWADLDVVCLRPWRFDDPHVFASAAVKEGGTEVATNVMRAPAGSEVMAWALEQALASNPQELRWGALGPALFSEGVRRFGLEAHVRPKRVFNPVDWWQFGKIVSARRRSRLWTRFWALRGSYGLHCYNECWRRNGIDKDGEHHRGCSYEVLKRRYGVAA